jgi:hypothetical protein
VQNQRASVENEHVGRVVQDGAKALIQTPIKISKLIGLAHARDPVRERFLYWHVPLLRVRRSGAHRYKNDS